MTAAGGWLIHRHDSVGSTMERAARLAELGAPERTAVVAAEQTAGRGRAGRVWLAPPGTGVLTTIILRPPVTPDRLSTLPLVTGVAVAEAIEHVSGASVQLKWPNDIWLGTDANRPKVAGILVTSSLTGRAVEFALVGIGINVLSEADDLPAGATSILTATGRRVSPGQLLDVVLDRFDDAYARYLAADGRPSLDDWRARAVLLGQQVTVEDAGKQIAGTFVDVDDDGALMLRTPDGGCQRVLAGDLARGPRASDQREDPLREPG